MVGVVFASLPITLDSIRVLRFIERVAQLEGGVVERYEGTRGDEQVMITACSAATTSVSEETFLMTLARVRELNHQCVTHVVGGGITTEGARWVAVEAGPGQTVTQLLRKEGSGKHTVDRPLSTAISLLQALVIAEQNNLRHGAIRPDVIVGDLEGVKLVEVGFAELFGVDFSSMRYRAPEQRTIEDITAQSDLFSIGAVIYEMLARGNVDSGEVGGRRHQFRPLAEIHHPFPEFLSDLMERVTALDPKDRHFTIAEARDEFMRVQRKYHRWNDAAIRMMSLPAAQLTRIAAALQTGKVVEVPGMAPAEVGALLDALRGEDVHEDKTVERAARLDPAQRLRAVESTPQEGDGEDVDNDVPNSGPRPIAMPRPIATNDGGGPTTDRGNGEEEAESNRQNNDSNAAAPAPASLETSAEHTLAPMAIPDFPGELDGGGDARDMGHDAHPAAGPSASPSATPTQALVGPSCERTTQPAPAPATPRVAAYTDPRAERAPVVVIDAGGSSRRRFAAVAVAVSVGLAILSAMTLLFLPGGHPQVQRLEPALKTIAANLPKVLEKAAFSGPGPESDVSALPSKETPVARPSTLVPARAQRPPSSAAAQDLCQRYLRCIPEPGESQQPTQARERDEGKRNAK